MTQQLSTIINIDEIKSIYKDACIKDDGEFKDRKFNNFVKFLEADFYDWVKGNLKYFKVE